MSFTVAVIGRPNVGKSTLFNRLCGKRLAIVDDTPGVTRDRREGEGGIADLRFTIIDTAGLDEGDEESLESRMRQQTERALDDADVALFLIDARAGVTPLDEHFAEWLRRHPTPVIVIANKCEGGAGEGGRLEAFGLGLGDPVGISAEHGEGLDGLFDALAPFGPAVGGPAIGGPAVGGPADGGPADSEPADGGPADSEPADNGTDEAGPARPLQLAIVGRPNVGKSTMINYLLGEERMLTGPEAGITRDSISVSWTWENKGEDHAIRLIDTAGLRRKARVREKLETLSVGDTLRTIRFAEVVVLVVDATMGLEKQDLSIARMVVEEGRVLILAVNKWDASKNRDKAMAQVRDRLQTSLPQVRGIPVITCSALTGKGMEKLLPAVFEVHGIWNSRVATGELNRWLEAMVAAHPPPVARGRRLKLRYMTQAKARPPTFILFTSRPDALPESYLRYLTGGLRDDFGLEAVPIRIHLRAGKNPYVKGRAKGSAKGKG